MDDADRAQSDLDMQLSHTLNRHKQKGNLTQSTPSADDCIECGNEIPSARQVAVPGCQLCVYCATKFELINKRK